MCGLFQEQLKGYVGQKEDEASTRIDKKVQGQRM